MNITITITSIICVTILIIVGIVKYVEYKLNNNNVLRDVKSELQSFSNELDINNRWISIYSNSFDDIIKAIQELKKESE